MSHFVYIYLMTWKNVMKTQSTLNLLLGLKIPVSGRSQSVWKSHIVWITIVLSALKDFIWEKMIFKLVLVIKKVPCYSPLPICVSWNSSVSFPSIYFPLIKQEAYQWLSHQGIVPALFMVFLVPVFGLCWGLERMQLRTWAIGISSGYLLTREVGRGQRGAYFCFIQINQGFAAR